MQWMGGPARRAREREEAKEREKRNDTEEEEEEEDGNRPDEHQLFGSILDQDFHTQKSADKLWSKGQEKVNYKPVWRHLISVCLSSGFIWLW